MPIYGYQCPGCAHQFELKQGFSAEPYAQCPRCKAVSRRVFHPVPVIYKGSGFYTTDYARKSKNGTDKASKENGHEDSAGKVPAAAASNRPKEG